MAAIRFETADQALIAALPELQPCLDRLVTDWDDFEGERPGPYLLFAPYRTWVEVLCGSALRDDEARRLLRRAFQLAEQMLTSDDLELRYLAIDACPEVLCRLAGGYEVAELLGGPALRDWMSRYCRPTGGRTPFPEPEIVDEWGVREALAALLPRMPMQDLPGITEPAEHHRIRDLAAAKLSENGVVVLHAFGKSGLLIVARASLVRCDVGTLDLLAAEVAPLRYPADPAVLSRGTPTTSYFDIPAGERVWNMKIAAERHARLTSDIDLWVAPELADRTAEIRHRITQP